MCNRLDKRAVRLRGYDMQKITIVAVGKIKEAFYREAVAEYVKRLSRFARVEIREIAEGASLQAEGVEILRACKGYTVALAVEGEKLSSEALAAKIQKCTDAGKDITFIIGSSCGLSDEVKKAADYKLSFSDMTFPHQLMRVILCEQIYRAFMINNGSTYHK